MTDLEKVIKALECCVKHDEMVCTNCPYYEENSLSWRKCEDLKNDSLKVLKEQQKEIKALRLLVEWAEECDFGFDNFPEEYERYKNEIKDMSYIDGMIHVARRTLEERT